VPAQAEFNAYSESDVVAILSARVGSAVQPAALELCAKHASCNARRAIQLCLAAVQYADSDITNGSKVVTLIHMEQTIRSKA
jgi:Cdc6-like AAA superfamily ATPase